MLACLKIGMECSVLLLNNAVDTYVKIWLMSYYWPYFVAGNIDSWIDVGTTLNGIKPMCSR